MHSRQLSTGSHFTGVMRIASRIILKSHFDSVWSHIASNKTQQSNITILVFFATCSQLSPMGPWALARDPLAQLLMAKDPWRHAAEGA